MQKLVTVYLDNTAYGKPKDPMSYAEKHGLVEEHLQEFLTAGWQVRLLFGMGGGTDGYTAKGWVTAVLERESK